MCDVLNRGYMYCLMKGATCGSIVNRGYICHILIRGFMCHIVTEVTCMM